MYTVPQSEIILFSVEGQILADSILMDSGSLPDAVEGDTGSWGEAFVLDPDDCGPLRLHVQA